MCNAEICIQVLRSLEGITSSMVSYALSMSLELDHVIGYQSSTSSKFDMNSDES